MAVVTCGWSLSNGSTYVQTSTYSSSGAQAAARFTITSVTYNTSTDKVTINGNLKNVNPGSGDRWNCAAYAWFIDGVQKDFWHGGSSGSYSSTYWRNANNSNWTDAMSCSQAVTKASTYTIKVQGMYNGGYSASRWSSSSYLVNNSATLTVTLPTYYLDLNGWLDGASSGNISGYGTADVNINGSKVSEDITDYYTSHPANTSYSFTDIKATTGHTYNGVYSGSTSGTITNADVAVVLSFSTNSYSIAYNANGGTSTPTGGSYKYNTSQTLASAISKNNTDSNVTITVSYNANNGTGAPSASTGTAVNTTPYTFNKWALNSTSGTQYSANASYTIPASNSTFYATWTTGTTTRKSNPSITLSSTRPTRSGYDFLGWATSSTATTASYQPGTAYTFSANTTLYAVWRETKPSNLSINGSATDPFTITLNWSATGVNISNYTVYYNGTSKNCGTSTSTTLTSLNEETTYTIYFTATNPGGTTTSSSINITTPADQAKIRIKKNNQWVKGKTYFQKNGQWVKAKKIYIKKNGNWVIGSNYDPN